jgi:hypothetical protein
MKTPNTFVLGVFYWKKFHLIMKTKNPEFLQDFYNDINSSFYFECINFCFASNASLVST